MQVSQPNDVKIYNLTAGKSLPEWLPERKRRQLLKNDEDLRKRVELLQDFEMPTASTNIKLCRNGQYLLATGVYKPRVRCYELAQLSMKFERYLTADIIAFDTIAEDYSKLVFLHADRVVEVHAQYGFHYKTRIPKFGRDLAYHYASCDLFVVGASSEIYRLNLDQGRQLKPYTTRKSEGVNVCAINPLHGMLSIGTQEGHVECFDPRMRECIGTLDVAASLPNDSGSGIAQVTALSFFDGLTMAVGSSDGHVMLYDIRSSVPMLTKDHNYGLPIKRIVYHKSSNNVMSMDSKVVKLWDKDSGKNFTTVEGGSTINDMCVVPDTGLVFLANEAPKLSTFFIPALGAAPKWCSYLDSITEELEEEDNHNYVYDDFKFVTREELTQLDLMHLIGSNLLRAYMHGFFMDARLYNEVKTIVNPLAYDEYRKATIEKAIENSTTKRLKLKKAVRMLPKVNKSLAQRLLYLQGKEKESKIKKAKKSAKPSEDEEEKEESVEDLATRASNPLGDDRFKALFQNSDFQVDQESLEYKLLHPIDNKDWKHKGDLLDDKFNVINEEELSLSEEDDEMEGRPSDEDSDDDDMRTYSNKPDREIKSTKKNSAGDAPPLNVGLKASAAGPPGKKFFELSDSAIHRPGSVPTQTSTAAKLAKKTFGQRVKENAAIPQQRTARTASGGMVISYELKKPGARSEITEPAAAIRKDRRGVRSLQLPKDTKQKYWRGKPV